MKCRTPVGSMKGELVECINFLGHLVLPTNTITHQRELFGGHLEPSKTPRSKRQKPSQLLTKSIASEVKLHRFGALASSRKPGFGLRDFQ